MRGTALSITPVTAPRHLLAPERRACAAASRPNRISILREYGAFHGIARSTSARSFAHGDLPRDYVRPWQISNRWQTPCLSARGYVWPASFADFVNGLPDEKRYAESGEHAG